MAEGARGPSEESSSARGGGPAGVDYGFGELLLAQAQGDLEGLRARGRPTARVTLDDEPVATIERLGAALGHASSA